MGILEDDGAAARAADQEALESFERILGEQPGGDILFFDPRSFAWHDEILDCFPVIQKEYGRVAELLSDWPTFQDLTPAFAESITQDDFWKVFAFKGYGVSVPEVVTDSCPHTRAMVEGIPEITSAMFSVLYPGKNLVRHRGPYKGVLRVHLGLDVPSSDPDVCGIRLFAPDGRSETRPWANGELLVFDDTFEHEAWNLSDRPRAVLFIDVLRPIADPHLDAVNQRIVEILSQSPVIRNPNLNAQFKIAMQLEIERRKSL